MTDSSSDDKTAFQYSWCMTDIKDGTHIRSGFRKSDYMYDEPYATQVRDLLNKLGLPEPTFQDVFRGTHHDLIFIASHGVVLRIGPTDVKKLISPGILQPLGWLESKDLTIDGCPFTVAIYPGIEHPGRAPGAKKIGNLTELFNDAGQYVIDTGDRNQGIIRIANDDNEPVAVNVMLDIDNEFASSMQARAEKLEAALKKYEQTLSSPADVLAQTMQEAFQDVQSAKYYQRAFDAHQPLREMFWEAFKDKDAPDATARDNFWGTCATLTNKPQKALVPLWRMTKDQDGKISFVRKEVPLPQISLHTPWTYNPDNRAVTPIHPCNPDKRANY